MGVRLSWEELAPFLTQGGITSVLAFIAYRMHRDAVDAHDKRANDARERAEAAEARAELREQQINILVGRRNGGGRPGR
jgi:hypothetical protein